MREQAHIQHRANLVQRSMCNCTGSYGVVDNQVAIEPQHTLKTHHARMPEDKQFLPGHWPLAKRGGVNRFMKRDQFVAMAFGIALP
jgi:hypothetical protein